MTYKTEAERREEAPSAGELAFQEAIDNANRRGWWSDHNNIHFLMEYLCGPQNTTETYLLSIQDAMHIVEKPWHYTDEFVLAIAQYASDMGTPFEDEMSSVLGAPKVTVTVIEVPDLDGPFEDEEYLGDGFMDEDMFRGER